MTAVPFSSHSRLNYLWYINIYNHLCIKNMKHFLLLANTVKCVSKVMTSTSIDIKVIMGKE